MVFLYHPIQHQLFWCCLVMFSGCKLLAGCIAPTSSGRMPWRACSDTHLRVELSWYSIHALKPHKYYVCTALLQLLLSCVLKSCSIEQLLIHVGYLPISLHPEIFDLDTFNHLLTSVTLVSWAYFTIFILDWGCMIDSTLFGGQDEVEDPSAHVTGWDSASKIQQFQ